MRYDRHLAGAKIVGICGHPLSGKTEIQTILAERHGFTMLDTAWIQRFIARELVAADFGDLHKPETKAKAINLGDKQITMREFMGEVGNALEKHFGDRILTELTIMRLARVPARGFYSMCVRRDQAEVIHRAGGFIVGVRNAYVGPSGYEFDAFCPELVDLWLHNDYDGKAENRVAARERLAQLVDQELVTTVYPFFQRSIR